MRIERIIKSMGIGACKPYLVSGDDGKKYVAKFPGNPEGKRVLVNEYVCAELAKLFGLPIPNYTLSVVDNISEYHLPDIRNINGTVYCSEFLEKANPVPGLYILTKVTNPVDVIKTLIFDVIVGNNDRNPGNILINFKNNSFAIVDHSHVFVNQAIWDSNSLRRLVGAPIDISTLDKKACELFSQCLNIIKDKSQVKEFITKVKSIESNKIDDIINSIPDDWEVSSIEKRDLFDFINDRINRVDEICILLNI